MPNQLNFSAIPSPASTEGSKNEARAMLGDVSELCDYYLQALQTLQAQIEERADDAMWVRQQLPLMDKLLKELRELLAGESEGAWQREAA